MRAPFRMTTKGLLIAALAIVTLPLHAQSDNDVQAQLVKLTQELMDALILGKADVWQRILADDAVIIDEFGRIQDKADAVKSIHPFPQGLSGSIEIRDSKVRVHGDTAVLQGELYERETVFGQNLLVRYIFCNTFVRRSGAWQLIAATDVTLPTEPPALKVSDLVVGDYPGMYSYGPKRAFTVAAENATLFYTTKAGGPHTALDPIAKDVFMSSGDERNLVIFRRDPSGRVVELIERRKFNDLRMTRGEPKDKT
ncbi:MAG TPA: nuclear transport factor 2 family protein [Rhodanobacteraceae bacterium]|nr:nuclear transport factor 2 family protein [Rhodanobacteraceae bacterium]